MSIIRGFLIASFMILVLIFGDIMFRAITENIQATTMATISIVLAIFIIRSIGKKNG